MSNADHVSLDAPASPEQLDRCVRVTSPLNWLATLVILLIGLAVAAWGVLGELPSRVQGLGFAVLAGSQTYRVSTVAAGLIGETRVSSGQSVDKGDVLFTIVRPDAELLLKQAEERQALLERGLEELESINAAEIAERRKVSSAKIAAMESQTASQRRHLAFLQQKLADQQQDLARGFVKRTDVEDTQTEINAAEVSIADLRNRILGETSSLQELENARREKATQARRELDDAVAETERLRLQVGASEEVRSTEPGKVLEVSAKPGDSVAAGDQLALMELSRGDMVVRGYLTLSDAQQVAEGLPVQVSLASVAPEIYGTISGRVVAVGEAPETRAGLLDLYESEDIVDVIMREGPPYQVEVALIKDSSTPSGFKWSTSAGPLKPVAPGSLANIAVTYETRRPIEFILPVFSRMLGLGLGG